MSKSIIRKARNYKYFSGNLMLSVFDSIVNGKRVRGKYEKIHANKAYDFSKGNTENEWDQNDIYISSKNKDIYSPESAFLTGLKILYFWKKDFIKLFPNNNFYLLLILEIDHNSHSVNLRFEVDRNTKGIIKHLKSQFSTYSNDGIYHIIGDINNMITDIPDLNKFQNKYLKFLKVD